MKTETKSEYDIQAEKFLTDNGLKFRATLSDTKSPQWESGGNHGHHYRVTISRSSKREPDVFTYRGKEMTGYSGDTTYVGHTDHPQRLVFDFWSSIADAEAGITTVKPYSVLACISGDIYTPETFKDFCAEYGYNSDSITALQQFRRCSAFAKRLRAFFTDAEAAQLSEIR